MIGGERGRPLRFLALVTTGWVGIRVTMLWPPIGAAEDALQAIAPIPLAAATALAKPSPATRVKQPVAPRGCAAAAITLRAKHGADPMRAALAVPGPVRQGDAQRPADDAPLVPGLPRPAPPAEASRAPSRWSASLWLVARSGSGISPGSVGGQLGGSQAGARLAYLLDRKHRIALAARITTPLAAGLREAALGVEWQPARLPVRIVAEQRFAIDGGRGGPALGVVGGVGPVGLPAGFRLEAYGQAGVIHRAVSEAYADGAVRMTRTLTTIGPARIDLGAGAWGAAQRGAARLDIGPSLGLTVPLRAQPVRLSLDWRQRIAGDARPGSGPALTLGTDF